MIMKCNLAAYMTFRIGDDFKLYTTADDVDVDIIEIDSYFKTRIDK